MKCPVDDTELVMSERQNVEIDYCPKCRGVWLDRGELDKIIEKTNNEAAQQYGQNQQSYENYSHGGYDHSGHDNRNHNGSRQRRGGFLGGLFD
ncbi:MAG: hypothetical protein EOT05_04215 [Candidatus Microsaccharimonas sossegonensis]|uniref:Transcription factor zinc-finger domain-containing protein n=1 Tax=Candidatus Microsaccharimonas sossegonensis TaxID=2506948 RepID=A0A4Q0AJQ7_9BACT|nr:MAG: hypothetical protein EOT05_04215 [Candidatus Microsaccharimonas sossegonensis]